MTMKNVFFILMVCAPWVGWGQTVEIEEAYLNNMVKNAIVNQAEAMNIARAWKDVKSIYPVIPFDTATKEILVEKVIAFPGITKAQAFKRVKEWAALNFGKLDAVLEYEDLETGKIILEGFVHISYEITYEGFWGKIKSAPTGTDLKFSLVVTLKDGKAKVKYENLAYKSVIGGYMAGSTYVPRETVVSRIVMGFPLVAGPPSSWRGNFDLLNKTMRELNATAPSLEKYVRAVVDDYGF